MTGRIFYNNVLRMLEPSSWHVGWSNTDRTRFSDENPRTQAVATGHAGTTYELIYDLGVAKTVGGVAVINHNLSTMGYTLVTVYTGSTDNGTTWDESTYTTPNLQTYPDLEPAFAGYLNPAKTRRYWRFQFVTSSLTSTDELKIGQLCLFNAYLDLPLAPASPRQFRGQDTTIISRGLGGYESRTGVGPGSWDIRLQWPRSPGYTSHTSQVRDMLRYARKHCQWGREPIAWVGHDATAGVPIDQTRPTAYCVIERIDDAEVLGDGITRHFDVSLTLRELTYNGLF